MQFPRLFWSLAVGLAMAIVEPLPFVSGGALEANVVETEFPILVVHDHHNHQNLLRSSSSRRSLQHRTLQTTLTPFNMSLCHGDCNTNDNCAGDLVCFQRSGNESVPGCSGTPKEGIDYCILPDLHPGLLLLEKESNIESNSLGFRLKLYWQHNYFWQERYFDPEWCMQCNEGVCQGNGTWNQIIECEYSAHTVTLLFDRIEQDDDEHEYFRIRIADTQWCLEMTQDRDKYGVYMDCDPTNEFQLWYGQNGDPFHINNDTNDHDSGRRRVQTTTRPNPFEIIPKLKPEHCLTISHHPTRFERTWVSTCPWARYNTASLWMKY